MTESEQQREERALALAYAKGKRDTEVDGRLNSHEARLNAINGSIDRHAREAGGLRSSIEELREDVGALGAALRTKAEVEADRAEVERDRVQQVKAANEKQISTKMFWLGIAAIIATILASVIASHGGGFG